MGPSDQGAWGAAEHRAQEATAKFVPACLPGRHRKFLEGLKISPTIGDYFFRHAGVRPGVPLDQQNLRDTFLLSQAEHGKLVAHGHTPSVVPEIRSNRIGTDTAAYATGRLTCLVLEKD